MHAFKQYIYKSLGDPVSVAPLAFVTRHMRGRTRCVPCARSRQSHHSGVRVFKLSARACILAHIYGHRLEEQGLTRSPIG